MFSPRAASASIKLSLTSFLILFITFAALGQDWRPIDPQEMSSTTPVVEAGADAEAIFWEVRVDDSRSNQLSLRNYVRIKIFTERGREKFARHDVYFTKGTRIRDMEARVTTPSGAVSYVEDKDVLERDVVRASGLRVRAKTLVFPALEVGSIIEYRYREVISDGAANMRLIFQRDIPIRDVSYYVKPFSGTLGMAYHSFNARNTKFEKDKGGFYKATMMNVPAFTEEPSMLPEDEIRSWIYIYYTGQVPKSPDEYWKGINTRFYEATKNLLRPNKEVETATAQLLAGASADDEKLRRIYDFTKTQIRNITYAPNVTEDERKEVAKNKSAGDTLKLRKGSASDIDQLFGAMARAAGYDARIALSGNRSDMFFNRQIMNVSLMLGSSSIAVKIGEDWHFFSPASYFTPYGMMSWIEEDQMALILDSKEPIWKLIPLSDADKSQEKRTGKFKLLPDGTLEGEGRIEFHGHRSYSQKMINRGDSAAEQEARLKNYIRSNIHSTAEIQSFTIENVDDPQKPFIYTFKIKVPGYASRTGRRLFLQPNVLKRSAQPRFTASERRHEVYISYPYSENDEFTIELSEGFTLENADVPAPIKDPQGISSHVTTIGVGDNGRTLVYKREFAFGMGGFIRFPTASYPTVKNLFEHFNRADVHQLTLSQAQTTGASADK